jgi:membrane protease YdiL (CAAX protease family)
MAGVLPAFLLESLFFLAVGFAATRAIFSRITPPVVQSLVLWVSSFIPYLLNALTAQTFDSHSFLVICSISAVVSFWWVVFPRRLAFDIAFLCVAAAVIVVRLFSWLYLSPMPHFDVDILGHLMWIRITFLAFLVQRGFKVAGVGFWPHAREWREGFLQFSIAIVPLSLIAVGLHVVKFAPQHVEAPQWIGLAIGYFAGTFLVVAFSEDIFRSIITELFLQRKKPVWVAVSASALILGATHLGYRGFPNWGFALVGAIGHLFYTIAYVRARSVRASMVAHALTVVAWRMFFRS